MLSNIFALTASGGNGAAAPLGMAEIVIGVLIMVVAALLIVAVLLQSSKDKSLSGSISGAAETFFSKSKTGTMDKILSRATFVLAIIFAILVVVMYLYVS